MIERVLEQEQAIRVVLTADRKASHHLLSWQDLDVIKAINAALSPLAEFTDVLSGEKYVTVSALLPVIDLLQTSILVQKTSDVPLTNELRSSIMRDLLTRNQDHDIVRLLQTSSFLDPRFKEQFIEDVQGMKDAVMSEAVHDVDTECSSSPVECPMPPPTKRMKRSLGSLLKQTTMEDMSEAPASLTPQDKISKEIDSYLKVAKIDAEEDPLKWWYNNESTYPLLAKLSRKYLCIPATSTSSERVFSKAGQIVTPRRALLKPQNAEMLIFLSCNL